MSPSRSKSVVAAGARNPRDGPAKASAMAFDGVYGAAHEGWDNTSHFKAGSMMMRTQPPLGHAGKKLEGAAGLGSRHGRGNKGNAYDGMYGVDYEGWDNASHFKRGSMNLRTLPPTDVSGGGLCHLEGAAGLGSRHGRGNKGNAFDGVYGAAHEGWDNADHFRGGSILLMTDDAAKPRCALGAKGLQLLDGAAGASSHHTRPLKGSEAMHFTLVRGNRQTRLGGGRRKVTSSSNLQDNLTSGIQPARESSGVRTREPDAT